MAKDDMTSTSRLPSFLLTLMMLSSVLVISAPSVMAIGPNQNDLNSGGDLPDNTSASVSNYIFSSTFTGSGELDYGDDSDFLRVALNSNQGLQATLSFPSSTSFPNGTSVTNDFDLIFYDANLNFLDESIFNNPEMLNSSTMAAHNGMIYIEIFRYSGVGTWNLTLSKFTITSSSNSNGSAPPSPCTGNATLTNLVSDILEPNDTPTTATLASVLPVDCTGLSIHTTTDSDFFEVIMISGTTYYVNVTFLHTNGDLDIEWTNAAGNWMASSTSVTDNEAMTMTASSNQTTYIEVFGYSGATNIYDISIETNNPGGGQSFETIDVTMNSISNATLDFTGLNPGTSYMYNYSFVQSYMDGTEDYDTPVYGNFTPNGSTYSLNLTMVPSEGESYVGVIASLMDAAGTFIDEDDDWVYLEMLEVSATSSTTGDFEMTNLSIGTDYDTYWFVYDTSEFMSNYSQSNDIELALAASILDEDFTTFTATTTSQTNQITWSGPTTMNAHEFVGILSLNGTVVDLVNGDNITGVHTDEFVPQLPALIISNYSSSPSASTNYITSRGMDLVSGDDYKYQYRVVNSGGANLAMSSLTSFTATAQNMSIPMFNYTTPTSSGQYCVAIDLYSDASVQLIGDTKCFMLSFDTDNDGVVDELDLCANTPSGATVDQNGCALSQKDSDGDGYNDAIDDFPSDATQFSDMDGDGYGDNASGNMPDAFPSDASQWSDSDGDGYGDNPAGTMPDAFPTDPTQWSDADGDGFGDNGSGNNPDLWPADATQWTDSDGDGFGDNPSGTNGDAFPNDATQWSDDDGDGYGDNPAGTTPDEFPTDSTQWTDSDGDGYGDNPTGTNGDAFPNDATQWSDADGDGYGDNQQGTSPDAFPSDSTQWADRDGDGYGDNAAGINPDSFPDEPTQWADDDNDGYGDNPGGVNGDQCLNTPNGQAVNSVGCALSQLDDDMDGVSNAQDACPMTPAGETVDNVGCSSSQEDADNDGVMDAFDACPNTPLGATIDASGCALTQLDTDMDGVHDDRDQCPTSTAGAMVNGVGCAADERDQDNDGVVDAFDLCYASPVGQTVDFNGCAESQKDDDGDEVMNHLDHCPATANNELVDMNGCAMNQLDSDNDQISNADDSCPATPSGEQVDVRGCSDSQKDSDKDEIANSRDMCPDTQAGLDVDSDGCAESQKDDDQDGVKNHLDTCLRTPETEVADAYGCSLSQRDTDGDGVNDAEDAFIYDANESMDADGDGVADRWDAYPEDATRSAAEIIEESNTTLYVILTLILLGVIGGLGFTYTKKSAKAGPFDQDTVTDLATEANLGGGDAKAIPAIQTGQAQQWEEQGVHWSKDESGQLYFFDKGSQQWLPYQQ